MRSSLGLSSLIVFALGITTTFAQTLNPVLGNIQSPYNPLQGSAKIGGTNWGAGAVAYGPVGTPLVLTGSNLGGGGTVQFVAYKNGVVDTSVTPTQATVTLWTSTMLILTVPSGALSGMVTVTVEGKTSNGLPFLVMPGTYSGSCPAGPTQSQLQIVTSSLHDGAVGQAYSATLQATGGITSYSWSIIGTLPAGLSLNSSTGTISGTPTAATGSNPTPLTIQVVDSSSPNQTDQAEMNLTVQPQQMSSGTIYSYVVGYDGHSNVTSFQDQTWNSGPGVMGKWSITGPTGGSGYDSLNRLMGANVIWPDGTQQYLCWNYDPFGNRAQQEISSAAFQSGSGGPSSCTAQSSATLETDLSSYTSSSNQVTSTNARGVSATPGYDGAGDMMSDGLNAYLYDAEGRVCAVQSSPLPGSSIITGYLYDGGGNRVAKGTLTNCTSLINCSCDPTTNGFQFTENYVLGAGGEELTMLDGNNNWQRTNLYLPGKLIGTYDLITSPSSNTQIPWLHYHFEDPLGTRRMQVSGMQSNLGQPEVDFQSLPFGDQLAPFTDVYADPSTGGSTSAIGATPLFFTGKERDPETGGLSGNDYFGARYYSSPMGRFLSPDWSAKVEPVPYSKLENPQTLNLYAYLGNNPLMGVDLDGHDGQQSSDGQALPPGVKDCHTNNSCGPGPVSTTKGPQSASGLASSLAMAELPSAEEAASASKEVYERSKEVIELLDAKENLAFWTAQLRSHEKRFDLDKSHDPNGDYRRLDLDRAQMTFDRAEANYYTIKAGMSLAGLTGHILVPQFGDWALGEALNTVLVTSKAREIAAANYSQTAHAVLVPDPKN